MQHGNPNRHTGLLVALSKLFHTGNSCASTNTASNHGEWCYFNTADKAVRVVGKGQDSCNGRDQIRKCRWENETSLLTTSSGKKCNIPAPSSLVIYSGMWKGLQKADWNDYYCILDYIFPLVF